MFVADARITNAMPQLMCNPFAFCLGGRHAIYKSLDAIDEVLVTVVGKVNGEIPPAAFDMAPCFCEFVFTCFGADVPFEQFGRYGLGLCTDVCSRSFLGFEQTRIANGAASPF
jgi:hypothetical protein